MFAAIKYRSYPTASQERQLAQMFGNQRFVWNYFLALQKTRIDANLGILSRYSMQALLPTLIVENPWLKESKVDSLRTAIEALANALQRFFQKQSRFPKFKSKRNRKAVTTVQVSAGILRINRALGPIAISEHRPIPAGKRKRLTVSLSPSGKYFTSLLVETGEPKRDVAAEVSGVIGIDEGLTSFVTLSTGRKLTHGKHYQSNLARLKREQRRLSRKAKGSNRRERQRIRIAKLQEKISNARAHDTHLISTNLVQKAVRENQAIAFQKSNIAGQMKNRHLAMAISDAGWGGLRGHLVYKCARAGVPLIEIDRWVPTSYPCHRCGHKAEGKTLRDREWNCANCGAYIDRDVNAARVIARLGFQQLRKEVPSMDVEGAVVNAPREASTGATQTKRVGC